jgi:hypothetical protein
MRGIQEPAGAPADRKLVRDAALVRISRTRRWTLAGAAALTAALAALASALLPGKSFGAKAHRTLQTATRPNTGNLSATPPLPAPANAAQLGVGESSQSSASPPPAPQPAPEPQTQQAAPQPQPAPSDQTVVVSGGS